MSYVRKEPLSVTFFAKSRGELQVSVVQEAFMKVLGPIAKDLDVQQDLEVPSKKECNENDGVSSSYDGSYDSCFASRRDCDERHRRQGRNRWYDHADIPQRERDEHHRDEYHREEQLGRDASPQCHREDNRQQQIHPERRSHDTSPRRYREERDSEGRRQQPAGVDQGADASPGHDVHDPQQVKRSRDESPHQASRARKHALVLARPQESDRIVLGLKVCSGRVPDLIEKWRKRQDLFEEYEPKPLCIHVLLDNCVWRLNIFTERLFEPDMIAREGPKKVFMISSGPGSGSDWTMAEYSRDDAQRREQVAAAKAIDKVRLEKKELMRKIEELAAKEEDLIGMSGDLRTASSSLNRSVGASADVHAELSHRRRAELHEEPSNHEDTGGAGAVWKNMQGTHSPSKSRTARPPGQPNDEPVFEDEEGVKYMGTKPKSKIAADESKDRTRRQLYEAQCVDGKFRPGPRTKYDAKTLQEQVACEHSFECLRWGANSSTAYASCTSCGARTVIHHWVERPEKPQKSASEKPSKSQSSNNRRSPDAAFMLNQPGSGQTTELFVVKVPKGMAMIDTGCRAAVGGARWHAELQTVMKTLGKSFVHEPQEEYFQFGPGEPILSCKRWIYQVGVLGRECELVISEVPVECPGLLGPDELAAWNVLLNFQDKSYYSDGQRGEMVFTSSGHLCMDLSAFPSPSFLASTVQKSRGKPGANQRELLSLLERTADQIEHYNIASDDDSGSDLHGTDTEESSHAWTSESEHWTTPSTEDDMQGAFLTEIDRCDRKWLRKGARRHVRGAIGTIQQTMREEAKVFSVQSVSGQMLSNKLSAWTSESVTQAADSTALCTKPCRKPGPWRVLEFFAVTMVTAVAASVGWDAFEPVIAPTWNLHTSRGQAEAWSYTVGVDPDLVLVNVPRSPWSGSIHARTPFECRRGRRERALARAYLPFISRLVEWQTQWQRLVIVVAPSTSSFWTKEPIQALLGHPGLSKHSVCGRSLVMLTNNALCGAVEMCDALAFLNSISESFTSAMPECFIMFPVVEAEEHVPEERFENAGDGVCNDDWSANELPADLRHDVMQKIPKEIRRQVRKAHVGLGHPSRTTFLRMMKLGGASPAALEYAKAWQCPVCQESSRPGQPQEASSQTRPFGFAKCVCCDLKYLHDADRAHHIALSMVDAGTSWHCATLLKNRRPEHVSQKALEAWIVHYGAPEMFVVDQGGEFQAAFIQLCEEHGIDSRVVGSHAPWQHGLAERHGAILGEIWTKTVKEFGVVGREKAKIALASCVQAKNSTMTRNGMTPEQAVFGRSLRWFESANRDDDEVLLAVLGSDGDAWLAAQIRAAARVALISKDASDKVRRAMLRKAPTISSELIPGSRVYFWSPNPMKGRVRADPRRWRGPATVIAKEGASRYYISWRARILLVAKENLRHASTEECAATEFIAKDAAMTADQQYYDDVTGHGKPGAAGEEAEPEEVPPNTPPQDTHEPQAPVVIEDAAEQLALEAVDSIPATDEHLHSIVQPEVSDAKVADDVPSHGGVPEGMDTALAVVDKRRALLDDVPIQFKRPRLQETPIGTDQLPMISMMAVLHAKGTDEWLSAGELSGLSRLLGRRVVGARVHAEPRKRLYDHATHLKNHRLSVTLTEESAPGIILKDDEACTSRPRTRMPVSWCGLTLFYEANHINEFFIDTPAGLLKMELTTDAEEDVREVYACWASRQEPDYVNEVYALIKKKNQKELDPKFFDVNERIAFNKSDVEEWKQWLHNRSVRLATPEEEQRVPKYKIISAPMRYVRTNRGRTSLEAKSRIIIPGHLDPQLGSYRTDSPTTSWLAVLIMISVALCNGMMGSVFDVKTAFLSGLPLDREVYVRAPADGLPATDGHAVTAPYALLRVLKGAYGLTEAPRLWYLRARQLLLDCGFMELRCARAVFTLRCNGCLVAVLTLHVDDGMLFGLEKHPAFKKAKALINEKFNIKQWHYLLPGVTMDYLGVQWMIEGDMLVAHMDLYVRALKQIVLPTGCNAARKLDSDETAAYRRLLAQARWPVSHVVPKLAYEVSKAAQKDFTELTCEDVKFLNDIIRKLQIMVEKGDARLKFHKMDLNDLQVVTPFDASFAREPGMRSQLGFMNLITSKCINKHECLCNVVEFQSSTIHRVVKSTLAAEAAALSTAIDRQLYLRLLLESLLYGEPECGPDWRHKLEIPGVLVTDAKSLYDHLSKTGSVPKEKQTLIDLLVARDLTESKAVTVAWVPTKHMLVDTLTKIMSTTLVFERLMREGLYSLTQTAAEQKVEEHRKLLRQGQRQRRGERRRLAQSR